MLAKLAAPGMCNPDDEVPCVDGQPSEAAIHGDMRSQAQRNHDALKAASRAVLASGKLGQLNGLPVTVRLLDPPLHEFLPDTTGLAVKEAAEGLTDEERTLYHAAVEWRESNPMLGTRGVRLGVIKPGLYEMQVRALMEAAADLRDRKETT